MSERDSKEDVRKAHAQPIERSSTSLDGALPIQRTQAESSFRNLSVAKTPESIFAKAPGPTEAVQSPLGCGHPLVFPSIGPGQVVLYIGSGVDIDCLTAAQRVGPTGRVISLGTAPAMIERARQSAREAGVTNVECCLGEIEKLPMEDASVDWVVSNQVIRFGSDTPEASREVIRVLKPGGRVAISAVLAETQAGAGAIWSARVEGVKVYSAFVASEITVAPAREEDLPAI